MQQCIKTVQTFPKHNNWHFLSYFLSSDSKSVRELHNMRRFAPGKVQYAKRKLSLVAATPRWCGQRGSGPNIEKQNIELQNIEVAKYRTRRISKSQNIESAKYWKCKISNGKISTTQIIDGQKIECKISIGKMSNTKYRSGKICNANYQRNKISNAKYRNCKISNANYLSDKTPNASYHTCKRLGSVWLG